MSNISCKSFFYLIIGHSCKVRPKYKVGKVSEINVRLAKPAGPEDWYNLKKATHFNKLVMNMGQRQAHMHYIVRTNPCNLQTHKPNTPFQIYLPSKPWQTPNRDSAERKILVLDEAKAKMQEEPTAVTASEN